MKFSSYATRAVRNSLVVLLAAQAVACTADNSDVVDEADMMPEPMPMPAPEPMPEPAPEPMPEPAPEPMPEPAPEPMPEPAPEPMPDPNAAPVMERVEVVAANYATNCVTELRAIANDADGDALQYRWTVEGARDRVEADGATARLSGGSAGEVRFTVEVADAEGSRAALMGTIEVARCDAIPGAVPSADGQKAYLLIDEAADFDTHRYAALEAGAHLAVADDQAELDLLLEVAAGAGSPWTGFFSPNRDGQFRSVTGEPGAAIWCPGEPNNAGGGEYASELWDINCLNDEAPQRARVAIFEFDLPGTAQDATDGSAARPAIEQGGLDRSFAVLPELGVYRISVSDADGTCEGVGDPMLRLLRGGDEIAFQDDTATSRCPTIELSLFPGLHDINVLGFNRSALPEHVVNVERMTALPELQLAENGAACPAGTAPLNPAYAEHFGAELCDMIGTWFIVRLANGAAFDGPGYGCNLRDVENEPLGHTFCAPQL